MKTPLSIFLGLALVAAAVYFKEPAAKSSIACIAKACAVLNGEFVYWVDSSGDNIREEWKTGVVYRP